MNIDTQKLLRKRRAPGPVQSQRSAQTREKVILAALECISEEGFRSATGANIAARSGISWGGIQHQFGGKEAIFDAVLEHVLKQFGEELAGFSTRATSIRGRVRAFVDAAWNLISNPGYRAFREIVKNEVREKNRTEAGGRDPRARFVAEVARTVDVASRALFGPMGRRKSSLDLLSLVLFSTLNGIAEQRDFADIDDVLVRRQLALLCETVERLLTGE